MGHAGGLRLPGDFPAASLPQSFIAFKISWRMFQLRSPLLLGAFWDRLNKIQLAASELWGK